MAKYIDGEKLHNEIMRRYLSEKEKLDENISNGNLPEDEEYISTAVVQTIEWARRYISKYLDENEVSLDDILKKNNISFYQTPKGKTKAKIEEKEESIDVSSYENTIYNQQTIIEDLKSRLANATTDVSSYTETIKAQSQYIQQLTQEKKEITERIKSIINWANNE